MTDRFLRRIIYGSIAICLLCIGTIIGLVANREAHEVIEPNSYEKAAVGSESIVILTYEGEK